MSLGSVSEINNTTGVILETICSSSEAAITVLPIDVLNVIFALLSNNHFLNCRLVCKTWKVALQNPAPWQNRIFPITISAANIPPHANFFSPPNYNNNEWQNIKRSHGNKIHDIVLLAKNGNVDAQLHLAERVLDKVRNCKIDEITAIAWITEAANKNNPKAQFFHACVGDLQENVSERMKWLRLSAKNGYPRAQCYLGMVYECGNWKPKNLKKAAIWYYLSAQQGNLDAIYHLVRLDYDCPSIPHYEDRLKLLISSAQQSHADSQNLLGSFYYNGDRVPKNSKEAEKWYHLAARQGHVEAACNLGFIYEVDREGLKDLKEAAKWYCIAAEEGNARAQNLLGLLYLSGRGVSKNVNEATKLFLLAAEQGYKSAQYNLATSYYEGRGVPVNLEKAFEMYLAAAQQGSGGAQYHVGLMYRQGEGIQANLENALKWLHLAADQKIEHAYYWLGITYKNDGGEPINLEKAFHWFQLAAQQGHRDAQYELARMCELGQGVPINLNEAVYWYHICAKQGFTQAYYCLGRLHENGEGVPKNVKEALKWYRLAGTDESLDRRDKIELEKLIEMLSAL